MKKIALLLLVVGTFIIFSRAGVWKEIGKWWMAPTSKPSNGVEMEQPPLHQSAILQPGAPATVFKIRPGMTLKTRVEPGKKVKICFRNKYGVLVAPSGQLAMLDRIETWGTGIWDQELESLIDYGDMVEVIVCVPQTWTRTRQGFLGKQEWNEPGLPTTYTVWQE